MEKMGHTIYFTLIHARCMKQLYVKIRVNIQTGFKQRYDAPSAFVHLQTVLRKDIMFILPAGQTSGLYCWMG
jgi:hypothetical protein